MDLNAKPPAEGKPTTPNKPNKKSLNLKKKHIILGILVFFVLCAFGAATYYYVQYKELKNNPNKVAQDEAKAIVAKISKLMTLPTDEQPTLATVLDKEKLKDQPFFKDSQNDDKIVIYTQAKKAIIFRENEGKIINVGPILLNDDATKVSVALLDAGGDTNKVQSTLNEKLANSISYVPTEKSSKKYDKIIVVDKSGQKADAAQQIANAIGGTVGTLQADDASPNADIVVIVP